MGYVQGRHVCSCGNVSGVSFDPEKTATVTVSCPKCGVVARGVAAADLIETQKKHVDKRRAETAADGEVG